MAQNSITMDDFLLDVHPMLHAYVRQMHDNLMEAGCAMEITRAKSGYVASYKYKKRTVLNYVFRKAGMIARIYGDHFTSYLDTIEALPDSMAAAIDQAPACKRLLDPERCSSRCSMGYAFTLRGKPHKKCRYSCFQFLITPESMPHIEALLGGELKARTA